MIRYHVNNEGNAGICSAKKEKCPFGGETGTEGHFDTLSEARAYYESKSKNKQTYNTLKQPKDKINAKRTKAATSKVIKELKELSEDTDEITRGEVANNPNITKSIAKNLLKDQSSLVSYNIAKNPKIADKDLPKSIIDNLDKETFIARGLSENPNSLAYDTYKKLSSVDDRFISTNLATNINTPQEIVLESLKGFHEVVSYLNVMTPENTNSAILEKCWNVLKEGDTAKITPYDKFLDNPHITIKILKEIVSRPETPESIKNKAKRLMR